VERRRDLEVGGAREGGRPAALFALETPDTSGGPATLFRIFVPDLRPQLTKQWNVFVERQLTDSLSAQVGYVGSRASHMIVPFDFNQPEPDPGSVRTRLPLDQRRPLYPLNPNIGVTSGTKSIGIGAYDALQASLRQRATESGLEFLASYTYRKSLSDNVGYYGVGWGQTAGQDYYYMAAPIRGWTMDRRPTTCGTTSAWSATTRYPSARGGSTGATGAA
jgi:hypothetical protein